MTTSFPFLRLPPELQIEVCKHYFGTFSFTIVPRRKYGRKPSTYYRMFDAKAAGSRDQICLLWTSPDIQAPWSKILHDGFNGELNLKLCPSELTPFGFDDYFNLHSEHRLPRKLPLDQVKVITLSVDNKNSEPNKSDIRMLFANSWDNFVWTFTEAGPLPKLEKIKIDFEWSNRKMMDLLDVCDDSSIEDFVSGNQDAALRLWLQQELPTVFKDTIMCVKRAGSIPITVEFCLWWEFKRWCDAVRGRAEVRYEITNPRHITITERKLDRWTEQSEGGACELRPWTCK